MDEPTAEMCTAHTPLAMSDGRKGYACWYPQMGGHASKAIVVVDDGGCFDAWVWHDGDFPFKSDEPAYTGVQLTFTTAPEVMAWTPGVVEVPAEHREPRHLHHCSPEDFITFGQQMIAFAEEADRG